MSLDANLHLLVTRPAGYGRPLAQKIRAQGGQATIFPTIEIQPVAESKQAQYSAILQTAKLCFFVSPNAAYSLAPGLVKRLMVRQSASEGSNPIHIISMGKATTEALEERGLQVSYTPPLGTVSETLLESKWFQEAFVAKASCALFTGNSGRKLVQETLEKRGAMVSRCEVYQSVSPLVEGPKALATWQATSVNVVLITSQNSLDNLLQLLENKGKSWLKAQHLLVISKRLATYASLQGFENIQIADSSQDDSVIKALESFSGAKLN